MQSGTIDPQEIAPTDPQEIAEWFNKRKRVSAAIAASLEESLSAALSSGELEKAFAKVLAESDTAGRPPARGGLALEQAEEEKKAAAERAVQKQAEEEKKAAAERAVQEQAEEEKKAAAERAVQKQAEEEK